MRQWLAGGKQSPTKKADVAVDKSAPREALPDNTKAQTTLKEDAVLRHLLRSVRSDVVRRQFMTIPRKEYTSTKDVRIMVGSYNVGGKKPPTGLRLHSWLNMWRENWPDRDPNSSLGNAEGPDIVAVGFQEIVPLSAGNVIAGPATDGSSAWDYVLAATLNGDEWAEKHFRSRAVTVSTTGVVAAIGSYAVGAVSYQAQNVMYAVNTVLSATLSGNQEVAAAEATAAEPAAPTAAAPGADTTTATTTTATATIASSDASGNTAVAVASLQQQLLSSKPFAAAAEAPAAADDSPQSPHNEDEYVQLVSKQLVGVYLSVWVRRRMLRHIRGVQATSVATGFGGYLGNKGAAAVRMRVFDSSLCLVCSHFAAGENEGDELRRNADFHDTVKRCTFPSEDLAAMQQAAAAGRPLPGGGPGLWGDANGILDADNVVWLGDLNYRISLADDDVRKLLRADRIEQLFDFDQLYNEMQAGRVFKGWREGPITFMPTYKYHVGSSSYSGEPSAGERSAAELSALDASADDSPAADVELSKASVSTTTSSRHDSPGRKAGAPVSRSLTPVDMGAGSESEAEQAKAEKKKRTPAWTDRILWIPQRQLFQLAYGRAEVTASDHRPVAAGFLLQAQQYLRDVVEDKLEQCRRVLDLTEMSSRPRCNLQPNHVELGDVKFGEPKTLHMTLSNVGTVDATFFFVPPPRPRHNKAGQRVTWDDNQPVSPPWLQLHPLEGVLPAGKSQEFEVTALVVGGPGGPAAAAAAAAALETICILRVEEGSDMFACISASYAGSIYGRALAELLQPGQRQEEVVPEPVQQLCSFLAAAQRLETPGILLHSFDRLCGNALRGNQPAGEAQRLLLLQHTAHVRRLLEDQQPLPDDTDPHAVAGALLALLQQLPQSLIPPPVADLCGVCVPTAAATAVLLQQYMSGVERAVLLAVLRLMRAATEAGVVARNGIASPVALCMAMTYTLMPQLAAVAPEARANQAAFLLQLMESA